MEKVFRSMLTFLPVVRQTLDVSSFSCGTFMDFQMAFNTVGHKILLQKLEYYGIRAVCKD